jgi:hypothetical protein
MDVKRLKFPRPPIFFRLCFQFLFLSGPLEVWLKLKGRKWMCSSQILSKILQRFLIMECFKLKLLHRLKNWDLKLSQALRLHLRSDPRDQPLTVTMVNTCIFRNRELRIYALTPSRSPNNLLHFFLFSCP